MSSRSVPSASSGPECCSSSSGCGRIVEVGRGTIDAVTSPEQRRTERYPADWAARYRLDPDDDWRACRVVDVSLGGAALELAATTPGEGLTGPLHLEIASVSGDQVGVNVRANIRR